MTEWLDDPLLMPWDAVKSDKTQATYRRDSRWFLLHGGFVDPSRIHHGPGNSVATKITREETERGMRAMLERLRGHDEEARVLALSFVRSHNARIDAKEIGTEEVKQRLKPIRLAFELNEILVPWKKVMRILHQGRVTGKDRPYALEEVRLVLSRASLHLQVPILFMCSSGIRVGAFEYLKVGDVRPVYQLGGELFQPDVGHLSLPSEELPKGAKVLCGIVRVYSDELGDEYEGLLSKEAYVRWRAYLETRARAGEQLKKSSPAVVTRDLRRAYTVAGIRNAVNNLLWDVGLRTEKKRRHEVQMDHGFRKVFDNAMNDRVDKVYVEMLIGHGSQVHDAKGTVNLSVAKHYDRHLPLPAVTQYLRAMPYLSVDEAYRNELLEAEKASAAVKAKDEDVRELRMQVLELKDENREWREAWKDMKPYVDELRRRRSVSKDPPP
ncbi:MAG: hypothetical protein KGO96_13145 [Elusimicrobia bacterium]|nr:hypothetical protein [Elusimicrobiota bacterium]MDE2426840.1 hypothetical protein [Elusimicrobiota bacterium]